MSILSGLQNDPGGFGLASRAGQLQGILASLHNGLGMGLDIAQQSNRQFAQNQELAARDVENKKKDDLARELHDAQLEALKDYRSKQIDLSNNKLNKLTNYRQHLIDMKNAGVISLEEYRNAELQLRRQALDDIRSHWGVMEVQGQERIDEDQSQHIVGNAQKDRALSQGDTKIKNQQSQFDTTEKRKEKEQKFKEGRAVVSDAQKALGTGEHELDRAQVQANFTSAQANKMANQQVHNTQKQEQIEKQKPGKPIDIDAEAELRASQDADRRFRGDFQTKPEDQESFKQTRKALWTKVLQGRQQTPGPSVDDLESSDDE